MNRDSRLEQSIIKRGLGCAYPFYRSGLGGRSTKRTSRTSSNGRSEKDKYSGSLEPTVRKKRKRRRNKEKPLYDKYG